MMKRLVVGTLLLIADCALSAPQSEIIKSVFERQESCQNFVRFDDTQLYLGVADAKGMATKVRVASLVDESSVDLQIDGTPLDVATIQGKTWVLTPYVIEEWDVEQRERVGKFPTHRGEVSNRPFQHAQGWAVYGDKIIIAHGLFGVSFFDVTSRQVTRQFPLITWQHPRESLARGVTIVGRYAYVVVDNYHPGRRGSGVNPFRGAVVIDMETEQVVAELDGMDAGVTSVASAGDHLIVSFGGLPIWKYSLAAMQRAGSMGYPMHRMWQFSRKGHPVGHAAIDDRYYYTCYWPIPEGAGGTRQIMRTVPAVLERTAHGFD